MAFRRLLGVLTATATMAVASLAAGPASADDLPVATIDPAAPCGYLPNGNPVPEGSNAPTNRPIAEGSYFSYPNRTTGEKKAIRDKVLDTINSTNGRYCVVTRDPVSNLPTSAVEKHGVVKVATWSFNDWDVANALKAAKNRGASVQALAARQVNEKEGYKPWTQGVRGSLDYYRGTVPTSVQNDENSWSHDCAGSCRGGGGTHHSKYFLFKDVGTGHIGNITVQTSMNLTKFAYAGQWNQATVWRGHPDVYDDFVNIFYESAREFRGGYQKDNESGNIQSIFFPNFNDDRDPVIDILRGGCNGGIRLVQYAIYDERGIRIAQRLRQLWNNGCSIKIIYSISSRPVLSILRARTGRGPIPMKQSTIKNRRGEVKKYNHSKWIAVGNRVLSGSCNWSDMNNDEQHQEFSGAGSYLSAFNKTWKQGSSHAPPSFSTRRGARQIESMPVEPQWGQGELKFLTPEG